MKWESSDFTVGLVVVVAALILLGSFLWLSPAVAGRTYPLYSEFDRIDGINAQSNVVLRGYNVGRVGAIEPLLAGDGSLRFRVQLDIDAKLASGDSLLLPQGTTARLVPPPVIGAGYILLETPQTRAPPLSPGSTLPGIRNTAILEQVQGLTDDVSTEVLSTMVVAQDLMDSVTAAVTTANRTLAETSASIPPLIQSLERQLAATEALTLDLQQHVDTIGPAAVATIDSVSLFVSESRALIRNLHGTVNATTPEIRAIVSHLDTTSILLNHFVRELMERPLRVLTGVDPPAGIDPPPSGPGITVGGEGDTVPTIDADTVPSDQRTRPNTGTETEADASAGSETGTSPGA